jgi:hypothetical protein
MDGWFLLGKSSPETIDISMKYGGNHRFSHEIWGFLVNMFP